MIRALDMIHVWFRRAINYNHKSYYFPLYKYWNKSDKYPLLENSLVAQDWAADEPAVGVGQEVALMWALGESVDQENLFPDAWGLVVILGKPEFRDKNIYKNYKSMIHAHIGNKWKVYKLHVSC